ncbi:MAG: T9SS type A sorting domain-containing protein [Flavobacteriales bacterium]|nr:T9SS type A sorting domain-containing protein [Flavobacteriales bacterium]
MKSRLILAAGIFVTINTRVSAQVIPSYVPTDGLVGWYPFSGNANDESADANNGTLHGGAIFTTDRYGTPASAIHQDVDGSYIRTQHVVTESPNNFTISFWANPAQADLIMQQGITGNEELGAMAVIHAPHGNNWGSNTAGVGINVGNNQVQVIEHAHNYTASPLVYSASLIGWHHFVLVYAQHIPSLYVDGVLVATGLQSSMLNIYPGSGYDAATYTECGFGRSFAPNPFDGFTGEYKGDYDDIGIWTRVLTQQEITGLYNVCQPSIVDQPVDQTIPVSSDAHFMVSSSATNAVYQWQSDIGFGFQNLSDAGQYDGTLSDELTVSNVQISNNNQAFRCIVTSENSCPDTSNTALLSVSTNTEIQEQSKVDFFFIYPNPTNGEIAITVANQLIGEHYVIIDNSGRHLMTGKIVSTNTKLDLDNLPDGTYSIRVTGGYERILKIQNK